MGYEIADPVLKINSRPPRSILLLELHRSSSGIGLESIYHHWCNLGDIFTELELEAFGLGYWIICIQPIHVLIIVCHTSRAGL
jgi:hypothetical protein